MEAVLSFAAKIAAAFAVGCGLIQLAQMACPGAIPQWFWGSFVALCLGAAIWVLLAFQEMRGEL